MQAPQNFASAHRAPAGGAAQSTRAAVHGIFQTTDALLAGFRSAFRKNARSRQKEADGYMNNLQRSVQHMLAEFRHDREDATNAIQADLRDYMADLQANVAEAMRDAEEKLRETSRLRKKAAHEFALMRAEDHDALCGNERQELEQLADSRQRAAQSLHGALGAFAEELHGSVANTRKKNRQELGFAEPALRKAKSRRAQASQPQAQKEEPHKPHKKSASRKAKTGTSAAAIRTSPAKAKLPVKAKKTVKKAASAPSRKRRTH